MRMDIRRLLKTFGIQADEMIITHIVKNPGKYPLKLKITMEDMTDYQEDAPEQPLFFEIVGEVRRS